jgi:fructokinase
MIGLGEVLWDLLPSGKKLGGAPANFAYMASVLGDRGVIASRVGKDEFGRAAMIAMKGLGFDTAYVQQDDEHPTGTVKVQIDITGQPEFEIKRLVSWDFLEWSESWGRLAAAADVICFGTLAQRSPISAATIDRFLRVAPAKALRIYDVNLRQCFYSREVLERSLQHAQILKLNDQELLGVAGLLEIGFGSEQILARRLLDSYDLRLVCVTRGARGSLLVSESESFEHAGFKVKVADSVGAGDAFTACLAHHYVRGLGLGEISEHANRFAALIATQVGATPLLQGLPLQEILDQIVPE